MKLSFIQTHNEEKLKVLLLLLIILLSRLPQLLNPNLLIDGDEGIVGVMTLNFLKGEGYPYFFASQSYGLTIVEVIFISISFLLFGVSALSLKLALLGLWSLGVVFFYEALRNFSPSNNCFAFIIIVLFILFPSWQVWSMKARGGYVTAFSAFSIILFLLSKLNNSIIIKSLFIGFFSVVIYQAQPLWLAGLAPILFYFFGVNYQLKRNVFFLVGVTFALIYFYYIKLEVSHFTKPPIFKESISIVNNLKVIPGFIYDNLLGGYYYTDNLNFTSVASSILVVVYLIVISYILFHSILKHRKINFSMFSIMSFLSTLCYLFILKLDSPRYLLPLSQLGFVLIYIYSAKEFKVSGLNLFQLLPLVCLGIISAYSFYNYKFENRSEPNMKNLITSLNEENKTHVYFKHSLLEWQIMFYSKKEITGRSFSKFDRFPKIVSEVDSVLYHDADKVAIVDYYNYTTMNNSSTDDVKIIDEQFIIRNSVTKDELLNEGFIFKKGLFDN